MLHNSSQLVCSEIKFVKALVSCSLSPPVLPHHSQPMFPCSHCHRDDVMGSERGTATARGSACPPMGTSGVPLLAMPHQSSTPSSGSSLGPRAWMEMGASPSGCSRERVSSSAQPGQLGLGAPASPTQDTRRKRLQGEGPSGWAGAEGNRAGAEGSWTLWGLGEVWTRFLVCSDHRSLQTSGILHEL